MTAATEIRDFAKSLARVLEARDSARSKQESSHVQKHESVTNPCLKRHRAGV
jgi:hypothetical protein